MKETHKSSAETNSIELKHSQITPFTIRSWQGRGADWTGKQSWLTGFCFLLCQSTRPQLTNGKTMRDEGLHCAHCLYVLQSRCTRAKCSRYPLGKKCCALYQSGGRVFDLQVRSAVSLKSWYSSHRSILRTFACMFKLDYTPILAIHCFNTIMRLKSS